MKLNIDSKQLTLIVEKAIKRKHLNKLRYIGQTLDCLLFQKEYKHYTFLFKRICNTLLLNNKEMLGFLGYTKYSDLDKIGFPKCTTFNKF